MTFQTCFIFSTTCSTPLLSFIFFGTVSSYNFHWYLTPPQIEPGSTRLKWSLSNKNLHLALFIAGLAGAGISFIFLLPHWLWILVAVFASFLYSAPMIPHPVSEGLKKIAVGKTFFLSFSWTYVTAILPLVIGGVELQAEHIIFVLNRFLLIYAICILFDYRDRAADKISGIKSIITYLNEKGIDILFWLTISVFMITSVLLGAFISTAEAAALTVPGIILCFLYNSSKRVRSDYRYYFILDGLMMLSVPLVVLAKFAR
jgi:4-hydroxybenzoate polyprenyltransferase